MTTAAAQRLHQGCPSWCLADHDDDFHRSAVTGAWVSELTASAEHQPISVYLEAYIHEDGATGATAIVIDGNVSTSEDLAEFSPTDARILVAALTTALAKIEANR